MRFLLILILYMMPLCAFENIQRIEAVAEAGQLDRALEMLQGARGENLTDTEKRVLEINISTLYLLQESYQSAVELLHQQKLGESPPPHIARRYSYNLSTGLYRQGKQLQESIKEEDETFLTQCDQMIAYYHESLNALDDALSRDKELAVFEGRDLGAVPSYLTDLHEAVELSLTQAKQQRELYWVKHLKLSELLHLLQEKLTQDIAVLELTKKNEDVHLLDFFSLWDRGRVIVDKTDYSKAYQEAHNAYLSSLDLVKEGRFWRAWYQQVCARIRLQILSAIIDEKDPVDPLLLQRVVIFKKLENGNVSSEFRESLLKENDLLEMSAADLLTTKGEDTSIERQVQCRLNSVLHDELMNADSTNLLGAQLNLEVYRQGIEQENDTFRKVLAEQQENIILLALREKWKVRQELDKSHDFALLNRQLEGTIESKDTNAYRDNIKRLFYLWDPEAYLHYQCAELVKAYAKVLADNHFDEKTLSDLFQRHRELIVELATLDAINTPAVAAALTDSINELLRAISKLRSEHLLSARYYFLEAYHTLQRSLKIPSEDQAQQLECAIAEELFALEENRACQDIKQKESLEGDMVQALIQTQNMALAAVDDLADAEGENIKEVLELIAKGKEEAIASYPFLRTVVPEFTRAYDRQYGAYKYWKAALDKLKGEDNEDSSEPSQNPSSSSEEGKEGSTEILELYQQMESEDRAKEEEQQAVIKQGLRPW